MCQNYTFFTCISVGERLSTVGRNSCLCSGLYLGCGGAKNVVYQMWQGIRRFKFHDKYFKKTRFPSLPWHLLLLWSMLSTLNHIQLFGSTVLQGHRRLQAAVLHLGFFFKALLFIFWSTQFMTGEPCSHKPSEIFVDNVQSSWTACVRIMNKIRFLDKIANLIQGIAIPFITRSTVSTEPKL